MERIYPIPRCENVSFERTETVFETAPSTRKYKIDGVGGVRSFKFELWSKNAVHAILRELKKIGCTDVDFYLVDIAGSIWGIKDDINGSIQRGYEMSTETFDVFKDYATDTTTQKIMMSWDLDNYEVEENSYAITSEELGYKATSLRGNIKAYMVNGSAPTTTTLQVTVQSGFGTANNPEKVVGLLQANFEVIDVTSGLPGTQLTIIDVVEDPEGDYLITLDNPMSSQDIAQVEIEADGYAVDSIEIEQP